jgi:hypothetical protein
MHAVIDQFDTPAKGKNLGDYVQTLATLQFCNNPLFIDREHLDAYHGDKVKMIMNSWFMSYPKNWPPSDDIIPFFISCHFHLKCLKQILDKEGIDYFKKNEPIGCRDQATCDILREHGINAYFSGCLTLTLGNTYKRECISDEILFVDTLYNYRTLKEVFIDIFQGTRAFGRRILNGGINEILVILFQLNKRKKILRKLFTKDLLNKAIFISQLVRLKKVDNHLKVTDEYLKRLSKARLVVTSRIHCALPCLAVGTPVIFIDSELDSARLSGLVDLFNTITINKRGEIDSNFGLKGKIDLATKIENKLDYIPYKEHLNQKCNSFINENS